MNCLDCLINDTLKDHRINTLVSVVFDLQLNEVDLKRQIRNDSVLYESVVFDRDFLKKEAAKFKSSAENQKKLKVVYPVLATIATFFITKKAYNK